MLNKAILQGRLTKDPELRYTQSNIPVISFTIAVNRDFKPSGQPDVDFIECVAWNKTAEFVSQWFTKGSMIIVTGRIQVRNWEDKNGNKRISTEIATDQVHFGESKKSSGGNSKARNNNYQPRYNVDTDPDFIEMADDSDVPF